ncbi:hypothetical protein [Rhodanobacter sp. MP1X3]|uniref:hypothetical protein n=1 Tax=Rhodanobacter sp. MP1X3 TaxID=2723086 RepID=UPI00161FBD3A|nr:hypothetical protein [Rhodanobacter sp. MP1X3]MBB6244488.1 hypothetical protein [Rhodanobacter sp. MP1X3]
MGHRVSPTVSGGSTYGLSFLVTNDAEDIREMLKPNDAKIREGNILISVHTEDSKQRDVAKEVFKRNHAEDIFSASEAKAK